MSSADFKQWIEEIVSFHQLMMETHFLNSLPVYFIPSKHLALIYVQLTNSDQSVSIPDLLPEESDKNQRVIVIWEDQWITQKELIQSRIQSILGITKRIHGRATKVKRIDKNLLNSFLANNHLNVITTAKFKYGLFYKDELVAVASFSSGRLMKTRGENYRSYELIRFANLRGNTVVGGLSKLLKQFIEEINPGDIMTYADREWSQGMGYEKLGFICEGITPAQQFWLKEGEWIRYYTHKLPVELLRQKNSDETEQAFLNRLGYVQIQNAGNYKYRLTLQK
ncbi:hypothetical protein [Solitalea lacus]|uniref:hypothetical protein n=1 Tax=Solitalea lacus TaxID=2911172 RepID=UPI001ED9C8F9|nr:hypothetical protein [Solitalea lacus]UKJ06094.1 hypothetical protein L2B55_11105 [Solitalea lacus]